MKTRLALLVALLVQIMVALLIGFYGTLSAQPRGGSSVSYNRCIAVTTSDTVDLLPFTAERALTGMIYVGGAGNVTAVLQNNQTILFTAPPVGAQLPIAVRRINATNTTATVLVACYSV